MLLTITTTHRPATDLGYLLEKHPHKVQRFELNFGSAHVFYPEVSEERCTAALLFELDPVALVRGRRGGREGPTLAAYVNDRPYAACSFLGVAIAQVFGSALSGRSRERAELAGLEIPLEVRIGALRCRGGDRLLRRLFEPLGYEVRATGTPLDVEFPEWGESPYWAVELRARKRLAELLAQLYVLIPVLDGDKHYFVGEDEVEKLVARGDKWLQSHPERELVVARFLKHREALTRDALIRLRGDQELEPDENDDASRREEEAVERRLSLNQERIAAVLAALKLARARTVLDLGCGEGNLLRELLRDRSFTRIVGMDVSARALERAEKRLRLDELPDRQRARLELVHGSLTYRDARLAGFDAACAVEVIEHIDPERLPAFERVVFEHARPSTLIVTTPNAEYNVKLEQLPKGQLRHRDHRFEWTREEFRAWASRTSERFGYRFRIAPIGPDDPNVGAPTQLGVFWR